jgi:hypothetical protein
MWFRNFKIWLVALSIALISACGSQDSADTNSANTALQTSSKSANIANIANTNLLDSLAVLYPKGQMSEQQKTLAAKELLQNPAALRKTAPAPTSISAQSASGNVTAQVATGNFGAVSRIQNTTLSGSYFFTIYDSERDSALALHPEWTLEGTAFYTSRVAAPDLSPVHRFQNKINGSYLYTIYDTERADIVANYSDFFAYEGVSWHARQTEAAGYTPLYRFRNKVNGTYLFSSYESEKESIIANYSAIFELEGIAYYVRQTDPLELGLLVGGLGGVGNLDGVGSEARFGYSNGVAIDTTGNAFVTDNTSRIIRKITPAGEVTTFAGKTDPNNYAPIDGTSTTARFISPTAMAIDSLGNLFVADGRTIRKITPAAVVTSFAGSNTGLPSLPSVDGTGTAATFRQPTSITIDSADNLYVADSGNYTIRKITPAGVVTTIAGDVTGTYSPNPVDGPALTARFSFLRSIAVDSANNLYAVDGSLIRKITGLGIVSTLVGQTTAGSVLDGDATVARFGFITGIKTDSAGNIFVADSQTRSIRKVTPTGFVTTFTGALPGTFPTSSSAFLPLDGTGTNAQFGSPSALAIDSAGNLFAMDSFTFRKITPTAVVTTIAGKIAQTGKADGTGADARFDNLSGMVIDSTGNAYVLNPREGLVRKITLEGVVTTFAGGGAYNVADPSGDGTGTGARFQFPITLAIDAANNLYVGEQQVIRKITPAGVVTTIAGARPTYTPPAPPATLTSVDGTGTAARFRYVSGMAVDAAGNLFVNDQNIVRKITPGAVVTTFAGSAASAGLSTDGNGAAAQFGYLSAMAIDSTGTLYVSDGGKIRKITPTADVSTFAGGAGFGYVDGDLTVAKFISASAITFDASNNMYLADSGNNTIRKITPAGQVSTVVGTAGRRGVVEGLLSGVASLNSPSGVAVYGGKLYITDENSVLKVNGLP